MAGTNTGEITGKVPIVSHDTAICIIPPRETWSSFDALRSQHDKAFGKWPPHINFVYPFVNPDALPRAAELISSGLSTDEEAVSVSLDSAGVFQHRNNNIVFVHDSNRDHVARLKQLRRSIMTSLGQKDHNFNHHLTIGQTDDANSDKHKFLVGKIELLPSTEWTADTLYLLQRERLVLDGTSTSRMKIWGTIDIKTRQVERPPKLLDFDDVTYTPDTDSEIDIEAKLFSSSSYCYSSETYRWTPYQHQDPDALPSAKDIPKNMAVGSYNVLAEFLHPPSQVRYPLVLLNIFAKSAFCDILVLQEVTDGFLSYLLRDNRVREHFPFASHGPPDQAEVNPLPNHVNIVVLSRFPFSWTWVPLKRRHKGSVVATFPTLGKFVESNGEKSFVPLVLAAVHLTCGLNDVSVVSKRTELSALLAHLESNFFRNPWIIAGDFNISTSSYTIDNLVNNKSIDSKTAASLAGLDNMMAKAGLSDTWMVAHLERAHVAESDDDNIYMGEQGATFDPLKNPLARRAVGQGFNFRPQRYDRILVRSEDLFGVIGFSRFGFLTQEDESGEPQYASDHWGVRCGLCVTPEETEKKIAESARVVPVELKPAPAALADAEDLTSVLAAHNAFPDKEDVAKRKTAVELIRKILIQDEGEADQTRARFNEVLVPVGSYGLGVWTPSSDVDCMVIGHSSSKTFMAVATQKLRRAASLAGHDVKILRRVHARTGTMLEISVQGIKMDLQYCAAPAIADAWPACLRLPADDPIFRLPAQMLSKLKAVRDMWFVKGSVPDLKVFRLAYRAIKEWARCRGLYAARFGYLGGIHISVMLVRVHKMLAAETPSAATVISVADLLTSFFAHYAAFDWRSDAVFDPFFHRRLRYPRSPQREPLSILGWHPPQLNTAHAASVSSTRALAREFRRADEMLNAEGMTWTRFLGRSDAAEEFLKAYRSYIKIDVQYWGLSLSKGSSLVGWLESRCVSLLVDMNLRLPSIHARIWPGRFVKAGDSSAPSPAPTATMAAPGEEEGEENEPREYQGHYLIGLDRLDPAALDCSGNKPAMTKEDEEKAHSTLLAVLRRFVEQIQGDERYYDPNWAWVTADVVRGAKLDTNLIVDDREWGMYLPPAEDDDSFSEDELDEDEEEEAAGLPSEIKPKGKKQDVLSVRPLKPTGAGKFRTSADVINRLRWDPGLDSGDYLVGYEDRFLGIMERSLDLWKGEQTDEEFIPQHRIVYFKRKTDGEIVWDRRTRRDIIFGSG